MLAVTIKMLGEKRSRDRNSCSTCDVEMGSHLLTLLATGEILMSVCGLVSK